MNIPTSNPNDVFFDLNDFISVIKKRSKLFFIIYLVLFAATLIYGFLKKPVYLANFTLNLSTLSVDAEEIINNFNMLYNANGINRNRIKNDTLSAVILNLKQIEVEKTDLNNPIGTKLKINIYVYETSSINRIIKELISYGNSNKYLVEKIKMENEKTAKIVNGYKKQLSELIIYKQRIEKEKNNLGSITYYNVYKDIANFMEVITRFEYELSGFKGFEVSVEPIIPFKPHGISLIQLLILAGIFGLILCVFVVFFFDKILGIVNKH
ncbi:MAG: hypothetical protein HYY40_01960 [Bacteroidetes bacterium]|nr:hypothetical protein [Bacteroidota bacterium]